MLGWSSAEAVELLETSVAAVNSALQRARATRERERDSGRLSRLHRPASPSAEQDLVDRFIAAWWALDIEAFVSLLREDALLTMPPYPAGFEGPVAIGRFFATVPAGQVENLSSRRCNPAAEHGPYEDVNVGLGRYTDPVGLVPGGTEGAVWRIEVHVAQRDGGLDYRGPQVDGKRGNRRIYINWLNRELGGELRLFQRGKIVLDGLDPDLVDRAERTGAALTCTVNLTNDRGHPTTGFFRPHELDWHLAK